MKLVIFCISSLMFTSCSRSQNVRFDVEKIKENYEEINSIQSGFTVKHPSTDDVDYLVKQFFDAKNFLRKMSIESLGETGKLTKKYYLLDDKLSLVYVEEYFYNVPMNITKELAEEIGSENYFDPSKTKVEESRFYFDGIEMIKWIDKNKNVVNKNNSFFKPKEEELLSEFAKLKNLD